jgi:hypothetical protein
MAVARAAQARASSSSALRRSPRGNLRAQLAGA